MCNVSFPFSFFFLKKLELDCKHNPIQAYESKLREGELVNRSFEVSMVFEKPHVPCESSRTCVPNVISSSLLSQISRLFTNSLDIQ